MARNPFTMKRFYLFLLACVAAVSANAIQLNNIEYTIDTLAMYPVGPGSVFYQLRMFKATGGGRLDCWLMTVDTDNPYVELEQVLGSGKVVGTERPSNMAKRKTTDTRIFFGGTNGDFFATSGDVGRPTGLTIARNEFCYTPNNNWRIGAVDEQFHGALGSIGRFSGRLILPDTTVKINHVNYTREENELVLYNQHNGTTTNTNAYGTELAVELLPGEEWHTSTTVRARITDKQTNIGAMSITPGQAVLSGHGTMATVLEGVSIGDTVSIRLQLKIDDQVVNISNCVGSDNYSMILSNGVVNTTNFWDELHPRTAFGASQDGSQLIFLVVDGRGQSLGCNTRALGEMLQYYGSYNGVNWDGGGSSCLYIRPFDQVNKGSDGTERACGNGMFAVACVPEVDTVIASIAPYMPIYALPRYGIASPKFLGYNQYGVLINTSVQGVTLSCDAAVGEIMADGRFLASGANGGLLHASLGAVSTDLTIRLMASAPIAIRLDSTLRDNLHPYTVEVQGTVNNATIDLLASALEWQSLNPDIAVVDSTGAVLGVSNGYADIVGSLGEFSDTIRVHIEIPEERVMMWNDFRQPDLWTITSTSGFNPTIVVPEDTLQPVDMQFTYKTGRSPFIRLGYKAPLYSLPDTVRIAFRTDAVCEKIAVGLRANNASQAQSFVSTQAFVQGEKNVVDIAVADLLGTDPAIWPVWFDYLRFPLETTTNTGAHHLWLDGVQLIYNDVVEETPAALDNLNASSADKQLIDGQLVIIKQGIKYNSLGQVIE